MLNYLTTFANQNGLVFPNTAAVDSSGGSATDGTEFIAAMINDSMWGVWQALLDYTGQTPNGITEGVGNSQVLEALRRIDIPGKFIHAVWNDDPATLGIRAMQLTGQGILRANYPELDALIYVGDTDNPTAATFYHADDAAGTVRNTTGAYLILPDGRGRFVRALDLTGSVDPDGVSRELGDFQDDAFQGHSFGTSSFKLAFGSTGWATENNPSATQRNAYIATSGPAFMTIVSDGTNGTPRVDSESRGINIAANLFITY